MADLADIPETVWREAERRIQVVRPLMEAKLKDDFGVSLKSTLKTDISIRP